MDVVVIGSVMVDVVIHSSRLRNIRSKRKQFLGFPFGTKTELEGLKFNVGGSGHNVAVGLSKLGSKVGFIGKVGSDPNSMLISNNFKAEGVDIGFLKKSENVMSGFSQVFITPDGERSILTFRGANDSLGSDDISEKYIKNAKWFIFTTVISDKSLDAVRMVIRIIKENGGKVLANPSINMIKYRKKELLGLMGKCDISIMNKEEICELMNTKNEQKALKRILGFGVQSAIITLGKKGLIASDGNKLYKMKPFKSEIKDTTGAGDSFTASFLHWFMKGKSFEDALKFGNAAAALNIESIGATKDLPSEKDIINLIERWSNV